MSATRVSRLTLVVLVGLLAIISLGGVLAFQTLSVTATSVGGSAIQGKEIAIKVADSRVPWAFLSDSEVNPTLQVKTGDSVRIVFRNNGASPHDFFIEGYNIGTKVLDPGASETIEFRADAQGTFSYYCSVPGHKQLGMEGQITVG